jgi:hypothetical protein
MREEIGFGDEMHALGKEIRDTTTSPPSNEILLHFLLLVKTEFEKPLYQELSTI